MKDNYKHQFEGFGLGGYRGRFPQPHEMGIVYVSQTPTPGEYWPVVMKENDQRVSFYSRMPVKDYASFKYAISIDNYDKCIFAFCLARKHQNKVHVLYSKTSTNEANFIEEVHNLATFLNCPVIGDKSIDGKLLNRIINL